MRPKSFLFFLTIRIVTLFIIYFAIAGCSLLRIVPIQMARVSQTEFYTQTFHFWKAGEKYEQERTDILFETLLGSSNWQNLKDNYGTLSIMESLENGDIYLEGILNITLYVNPVDHNFFLLEGSGHYYIVWKEINKKEIEILLCGDFYIPVEQHSINDLNKGYLETKVELFITRIPRQNTYFKQIPIKYNICMDTSMKKDRIYAIDYTKKHGVFLKTEGEWVLIGKMEIGRKERGNTEMERLHNQKKLIDLRGVKFLRNDYKKKLRKTKKGDSL